MTVPTLTISTLRDGGSAAPVLVVGPSLGTSVEQLWSGCIEHLAEPITVLGWDLPGHGRTAPSTGFSVSDLAAAVVEAVRPVHAGLFGYAGDSLGGAVGLQLLLDHADTVDRAVLCCTAARIGTTVGWQERAATVRDGGFADVVTATPARWFAPGFTDAHPEQSQALLETLARTDPESYATACDALADFDVRHRLAEIAAPVVAVAGADDQVTPVPGLRQIADGVQHGRLIVLDAVAHLAPVEAPSATAEVIMSVLGAEPLSTTTVARVRAEGIRVRREVLGDAHVDRASGNANALTQTFQELITQYAWGTIWTRPGLDRRSRSMITLTALIARGHHEELVLHLRAALRNGLTRDEIAEVILQSAIYCGVPDANTAFRIAKETFDRIDQEES